MACAYLCPASRGVDLGLDEFQLVPAKDSEARLGERSCMRLSAFVHWDVSWLYSKVLHSWRVVYIT